MGNPHLIAAFTEMLRRQTRTDLLRAMMRASLNECETDRKALETPAVLDQLVRDAQANSARSSAGPAAEMTTYSMGWRVPAKVGGHGWTLAWCEALKPPTEFSLWESLPNLHIRFIRHAGLLAYFTHPEMIVSLVTGKTPKEA